MVRGMNRSPIHPTLSGRSACQAIRSSCQGHQLVRRQGSGIIVLVLLLSAASVSGSTGSLEDGAVLLVITAAQDTNRAFGALGADVQARRTLFWPEGLLITPDTMTWRSDGPEDLAFVLRAADLGAFSTGGRFDLHVGRYSLDVPLLLSDGVLTAVLTGGNLVVEPDRILYSRPPVKRDPRGDYYILAGLILATAILLRAVRRRVGRRDRQGGGSVRRRGP